MPESARLRETCGVPRSQPTPPGPDRSGSHEGLAWALFMPSATLGEAPEGGDRRLPEPPWPGVVICHGAGSSKESHFDFARLAASAGWAALAFDQRGHGESTPDLAAPEIVADTVAMTRLLGAMRGVDGERVVVRGSSMGGTVAIHAAALDPYVAGVIAVCPAFERDLARAVRLGGLDMRVADPVSLELWLSEQDLGDCVESLDGRPLMLVHAEGDEQVPVAGSHELYDRASEPKRLLTVPGGHHRSAQHDPELQAESLRWMLSRL